MNSLPMYTIFVWSKAGVLNLFKHYTPFKKINILHTLYYPFVGKLAWGSGRRVACRVPLKRFYVSLGLRTPVQQYVGLSSFSRWIYF